MSKYTKIQQRIRGIENTQTITSAMQMVASSKLKKAQVALEASLAYRDRLAAMVYRLAKAGLDSPLLTPHEDVSRTAFLVIGASSGLAGPYNSNLNRFLLWNIKNTKGPVDIFTIGSRQADFLKNSGLRVKGEYEGFKNMPRFGETLDIANDMRKKYDGGEYDEIYIIYARFKNILLHTFTKQRLIPAEPPSNPPTDDDEYNYDYIFEPSAEDILDIVLDRFLETNMYCATLSAFSSEFGARTTAMKAATDNAKGLVDDLTLAMNHARQSAITTEVAEVTSGADAFNQ